MIRSGLAYTFSSNRFRGLFFHVFPDYDQHAGTGDEHHAD
jgi:hypothetical protein